jgi:hypothetical protein
MILSSQRAIDWREALRRLRAWELKQQGWNQREIAEAGAESVKHLVRLAETESAELLISHDPEVWATWPHAPKAYA